MKHIIILVVCGFLLLSGSAQSRFTLSGTIRSKSKGETLIGASVRSGSTGTISNDYGFYSITLPQGKYSVEFTALGFEAASKEIDLAGNQRLDIDLEDEVRDLQGVVVSSQSKGRSISNPQMGVERLSTKEIKNIPVLLGERDILKTLQLLPGIKSAGDGNSGFFVRGGASDQNLILLDEAPVYNASHLLGFFSTFNSDAIKDMTVYKGGMPAQYGGRLSSVLDLKMNDGNNQDFDVSGGIGLVSSKLNVEGPLQKGKSSFLLSGRRTYADVFLKLSNDSSINSNTLYFYDFNTKLNYQLGKKDRLFLSGYFGKDVFRLGKTFGIEWGNSTGSLRWNHIYSSRLFSNTSLIYSNYKYKISIQSGGDDFDIFSKIQDLNFKHEFQLNAGNNNSVRFGINAIHHTIAPGEVKAYSSPSVNSSALQRRYSWENAAYATNTWKVSNKVNVTYGLRLSAFQIYGKGDYFNVDKDGNVLDTTFYAIGKLVKTYVNLEPRTAISYVFNENTSLKASYVRNVQNLHLISNSTSSNPTDKWIASTNIIKPELSDQFSIGYYKDLANRKYELTIETYYKSLQRQIDYRDGANVFENNDAIEKQLLFGKGRAYGIEFLLKKKEGRFTGWLSYTLSKTERKIDGINNNEWYNARQDRTHETSLVGSYQLNKKWVVSATFVFYTGDAVTFPTGKYRVDDQTIFYYTERNGYRMPSYHRLDIGATCELKKRKKWSSELSFGVYNLYGRENAYAITFRDNPDDPNRTEAVQYALFRYVPSISYNFKF